MLLDPKECSSSCTTSEFDLVRTVTWKALQCDNWRAMAPRAESRLRLCSSLMSTKMHRFHRFPSQLVHLMSTTLLKYYSRPPMRWAGCSCHGIWFLRNDHSHRLGAQSFWFVCRDWSKFSMRLWCFLYSNQPYSLSTWKVVFWIRL